MLKTFLVILVCHYIYIYIYIYIYFLLIFHRINITDVTKTEMSILIIVWLQMYIHFLCRQHSVLGWPNIAKMCS